MRIATWNINGVNARLRRGALLRWLNEQKPDVVALQKINVPEEQFPTDIFDRADYYAEVHCGRNDYGVAILIRKNRKEPRLLQKGLPGQEGLGARLLTVDVDGLEFSSVYAPYGKNKDIKPTLEWFERLTAHFRATHSRAKQRVLCGDFNVVPEYRVGSARTPKDSPNYREDVREKFKAFLEFAGLFDLYSRQPSNWADPFVFKGRQGCLKFSRLEYVLGTQGIVDRNPVVEIDFDYSIMKNGPFYWVRAPIIVDLLD